MSGTTIDSSISFDPYATSFDASQLGKAGLAVPAVGGVEVRMQQPPVEPALLNAPETRFTLCSRPATLTFSKQTYSDFSPVSVFDTEDFGADFTSDSASPLSPLSPALSASSFGFPVTDAWTAWDSELSPEPENLFGCPPPFNSCPPSNPSLSPVINPLDLALPAPMHAQAPFFQPPQVMLATIPSQQHQPLPMTAAALPTTSTTTPTTDTTTAKRYPSRAPKRKSVSGPSDEEPAAKTIAISAPTTTTSQTARRPSSTSSPKATKDSAALAPKKTAHNMIEKRYRTNLNDKITQLRDAVPSLRLIAQRSAGGGGEFDASEEGMEGGGGLGGLAANGGGAKLNKATILSKATEYILQLERRNHGLETENGALRGRMEGLEMMLMSGRGGAIAGVWN